MRSYPAVGGRGVGKGEWLNAQLTEHFGESAPEQKEGGRVRCRGCGALYSSLGLDVMLPSWQWAMITADGENILCGSCIAERARAIAGACYITAVIVGADDKIIPPPVAPSVETNAERIERMIDEEDCSPSPRETIPADASPQEPTCAQRFRVTAENFGREVWHDDDRGPMKQIGTEKIMTGPNTWMHLYECLTCHQRVYVGLDARERIIARPVESSVLPSKLECWCGNPPHASCDDHCCTHVHVAKSSLPSKSESE